MISGFEAFADHWVIRERRDGLPHLRVGRYDGASWRIPMPEPVYSVSGEANPEFETDVYRYRYESFITPPSVMQVEVATGASTLLKETPVLGDYDRRAYTTERIWATASDGARVPISLVYRTDGAGDGAGHSTGHSTGHSAGHSAGDAGGPRPLHLTGYGAYGFAYPVVFSHARVSLLDRGVVCAVAHVRGGGELGKPWHDAGRMRHKRNTFTDFIAAAEHLVSEGRTAPDRLVIQGASAGGLLMGAVVNTRPDLARIAVAQVPFVDVLNTMLDDSLPLTVGEYEEWGDPNQPDDFAYIASYCPYTNVAAHDYPTLLVKTSLHDSQVMYWEPAKWVAKLRAHKTDDNPLVFHTNMEAGHGGSSGRYDKLREVAFDYAFVLWQLGVERVE
jgi:oligopeptidase B